MTIFIASYCYCSFLYNFISSVQVTITRYHKLYRLWIKKRISLFWCNSGIRVVACLRSDENPLSSLCDQLAALIQFTRALPLRDIYLPKASAGKIITLRLQFQPRNYRGTKYTFHSIVQANWQ